MQDAERQDVDRQDVDHQGIDLDEAEGRWQAIESLVDAHFREADLDGEDRGGTFSPAEAPDGAPPWMRLAARVLRQEAPTSAIDQPLAQHFGALLEHALPVSSSPRLVPGQMLGAYRVGQVLGEGGMGTVFAAQRADGAFDQRAALKLLHRGPADEAARLRFLQERQILAGLKHPHIARLLDGGLWEDTPYLVMERVDGVPITTFCDTFRLGQEERVRLLLQVCDAMRAAHRLGVIHRDLKPSNLLVENGSDGQPRVVVVDFGIALIEHAGLDVTSTGQVFGTPGYMAPEQALGKRQDVDRRSDVYALGVVLYELLGGRRPFEGDSPVDVLQAILQSDPTPLRQHRPHLSIDLHTVTMTCLHREPAQRYDSVRALQEDLERFLDGAPIAARPLTLSQRILRRARRHPKVTAVMVSAAVVTLTSLTLLVINAVRHARDLGVQRNAAVAAQQEAESLLDFMLKDLHMGLDEVGRLDLLEQVARRSLEYYEELPHRTSMEVFEGRAMALRNIGKVLEDQGDNQAAIEAYTRQLRLTEALLAEQPEPRHQLELARCHSALSSAFEAIGEVAQALEHAKRSLQMARQLADQHPNLVGGAQLLFESLALHGWLSAEAGDRDGALQLLHEAHELTVGKAEAERQTHTKRHIWSHRLSVSLSYLGLAYQQGGDKSRAAALFRQAHQISHDLVIREPSNLIWREELQLTLGRLGYALLDLDRVDDAFPIFQEAQRQSEILLEREPDNSNWQRELSVVHNALAQCQLARDDLRGALGNLQASLAISRQLLGRYPDNPSFHNDLAWDLMEVGLAQQRLGQTDAAETAWQEGLAVLQTMPSRNASPYFQVTELRLLLALERFDTARPLAQQLHAEEWLDDDLLTQCQEHGLLGDVLTSR